MRYILATHIQYNKNKNETYGPPHHVYEFLVKNNQKIVLIKHDIEGNHKSKFINDLDYTNNKIPSTFFLRRSIDEVLFNISTIKGLQEELTYIGVDPINSFSGSILKLLGRVQKNIYFTVDFANKRFENRILNFAYHFLDRFCLFFADEVWSVSSRIVQKRKDQGLKDEKNKFLPNSPNFFLVPRRIYDGNKNLIIVSHLSKSLNLEPILEALLLLSKKYKDIQLTIIGMGPEYLNFKKLVLSKKLNRHVNFLGQMDHEKVLDTISKSFLGFAIYSNEHEWNNYGDSMKTREYIACSIPVIINNVPSTSDEISKYNAGLMLSDIDIEEIYNFIEKCITNISYYKRLRKNATLLGRLYDKEKILKKLLKLK